MISVILFKVQNIPKMISVIFFRVQNIFHRLNCISEF